MDRICNPLEILQGNISQKNLELVNSYINLIFHWNKTTNITSRHNNKERIYDFVCEGIAISKIIGDTPNIIIADVGSGAGFPGIVLTILGYKVRLIEINSKKAAFLQYVIGELDLDARVYNEDVQKLCFDDVNFITSKAVTTTENIIKLCKNIKNPNTKFIICKNEGKAMRLSAKNGYRDYFLLEI